MSVRIAPSILSADLGALREQIDAVVEGGADWIHIDVMDGRFVPNLTFGVPIIRAVRKLTDLPLDVHLMVVEPENYIEEYADAGASVFTLHAEATHHLTRHLAAIHDRGMKAGVAINPATSLTAIEEVWDDIDLLLLMSVNPGFGGQSYLPSVTRKLRRARQLIAQHGRAITLEVDGGITPATIAGAWQAGAGADTFVAGTAVFGEPDPAQAIRNLRACCSVTL